MHPVLVEFWGFKIFSYGAMVALGFLSGITLSIWLLKRSKIYTEKAWDLALITILLSLVGARLFYVLEFWPSFSANPWEIFFVWQGGLVFFGGFLFGLATIIAFLRINQIPFWKFFDCISPGVVLGYAIGRIGCFFNGCCYGIQSTLPWAVQFPETEGRCHPTQLYATGMGLIAAAFLFYIFFRKKFDGQVFALGVAYFGFYRFLIEFIRINPRYLFNLSEAQWVALALMVFSVGVWFIRQRETHNGNV